MATNNMLNDEARRQIQNVIDTYDEWQQAEEQFKSYLTGAFGEIGNGFSNSIVAAFEDGTDAMEKWADNFNNVLKNLGKQLMQNLFFQKRFDQLQKDLTDVYDSFGDTDNKTQTNKLGAEVTRLMGNFFNQMSSVSQEASAWYEDWTKQAANAGFDLGGAGSATVMQSATSGGGFQTMSQDTGDELNGRFTAIQGHTLEIQTMVGEMKGLSLISINHLANIEKSTHELYGIATDIRAIKKIQRIYERKINYKRKGCFPDMGSLSGKRGFDNSLNSPADEVICGKQISSFTRKRSLSGHSFD
ncbi:MAG: hypothetical protein LIP01_15660 [Tannerellaceae bacterium]|nr:hypothetical protein [Tannerellaceae bacterium]